MLPTDSQSLALPSLAPPLRRERVGPPHQEGRFEQLADWVFARPVDGGFLVIRSYPFNVLFMSPDELDAIRAFYAGHAPLPDGLHELLSRQHVLDPEPDPSHQLNRHVSAIMLVTTACNLACPGCFASGGDYGLGRAHMSSEVVQATLEYLKRQMRRLYLEDDYEGGSNLGLHFFGGEPFIVFDRIQEAVESATKVAADLSAELGREIRPDFFVTTNGTLMTPARVAFLREQKITVLVSVDGPNHDERRFYRSGKGSLTQALAAFQMLREAGVTVRLNTVALAEDVDKYGEVLEWFKAEVYKNVPSLSAYHTFSFEREGPGMPVGACGSCYALRDIDKYVEDLKQFNGLGYQLYELQLRRKLRSGGTFYKCSTGVKRIAVDPKGGVYPCQGFIDPAMSLGSILDPGFDHRATPVSRRLAARNIASLRPCRDCVFSALCPHNVDCAARAHYSLGGMERSTSTECAVWATTSWTRSSSAATSPGMRSRKVKLR